MHTATHLKQFPNIFLPFPKSLWYATSQLIDNRICTFENAQHPAVSVLKRHFNVASGRSPVGLMSFPCRFDVGSKIAFSNPTGGSTTTCINPGQNQTDQLFFLPTHPHTPAGGNHG
jgi:hypothetical protein